MEESKFSLLFFFDIHTHIYTKEERERIKFQAFLFLSLVKHACSLALSLLMRSMMGCVYIYKMQQTVKKKKKKKKEEQHILEK
jgi:hypothetical protein